jgi:hypothetical protein
VNKEAFKAKRRAAHELNPERRRRARSPAETRRATSGAGQLRRHCLHNSARLPMSDLRTAGVRCTQGWSPCPAGLEVAVFSCHCAVDARCGEPLHPLNSRSAQGLVLRMATVSTIALYELNSQFRQNPGICS